MMRPPSDGVFVPRWVYKDPQRRTVMSKIIIVGLDLAKTVFQLEREGAAHLGAPHRVSHCGHAENRPAVAGAGA